MYGYARTARWGVEAATEEQAAAAGTAVLRPSISKGSRALREDLAGQRAQVGQGGPGGAIQVDFALSADNAQAISIEATGGPGGPAGAQRGKGGKAGAVAEGADGPNGAAALAGAAGANGTISAIVIDAASYFTRVAAFLGAGKTAAWADYRSECGIYFYRFVQAK